MEAESTEKLATSTGLNVFSHQPVVSIDFFLFLALNTLHTHNYIPWRFHSNFRLDRITFQTEHTKQGTRPMIMLRFDYTDKSQMLNSSRFGNMFMETVNNAGEIFLFKWRAAERNVKTDNFDMDAMYELGEESNMTMEDLVIEYFNSQTDDTGRGGLLSCGDVEEHPGPSSGR